MDQPAPDSFRSPASSPGKFFIFKFNLVLYFSVVAVLVCISMIKPADAHAAAVVLDRTSQAYGSDNFDPGGINTNTISWSHTNGVSSNGFLLVGVATYAHIISCSPGPCSLSGDPTSVTYGGVPMTAVGPVWQSPHFMWIKYYYLANPPTGANNVVVNWPAAFAPIGTAMTYRQHPAGYASTWSNVNLTTPFVPQVGGNQAHAFGFTPSAATVVGSAVIDLFGNEASSTNSSNAVHPDGSHTRDGVVVGWNSSGTSHLTSSATGTSSSNTWFCPAHAAEDCSPWSVPTQSSNNWLAVALNPEPSPVNPSGLSVVTSCNGSNAEVAFTFLDNSKNEDLFWIDVNGAAWTGSGAPSPWGFKTLNRSATEKTGTGSVTWIWKAGDVLSGTPTAPSSNTTYYWRVKAHSNTAGDSAHVYPPSSLSVPGTSFTTPNCVIARPEIPTPIGVDNVPMCVNPGQKYGTGLNFRWNSVANATSYTVRLTQNVNTGGDFSLKTVSTNSATGTGGWTNPGPNPLVTWLSGANLAMSPNVTYFFAVSASGAGGDSGYDLAGRSFQVGPVSECPPSNPSGLSATAGCDASGREQITFTFADTSSNEDLFWLDVNGASWIDSGAPSPWGTKVISRTGTEKTGTGVVTYVWTASSSLDSGDVNPNIAGDQRSLTAGTYWWRVRANNNTVGGSAHVYPPNTVTPPGTSIVVPACTPANPGVAVPAAPSCLGSAMEIRFIFQDRSVNEDQFILEVNDKPWTGVGPSPFGTKVFNRTAAQRSSASNYVGFVWNTAHPMDSGDTNTSVAGNQLTPEQSKTYYWRVRARAGVSNDSENVYFDGTAGTTTPPGIVVVTPSCRSDLSVRFDNSTWRDSLGNDPGPLKKFEPKERITVDVVVENLSSNNSPATDLYVFYKDQGNGMPDCGATPSRAITTTPVDSTGSAQRYAIPVLAGLNVQTRISISVAVDSLDGVLYAYAVPKCEFDSSPWDNNKVSQAYTIDSDGFIQSQGGGVGAVGDISMAVKSKNLTPPIYQGDYIVNANTMNTNVDSKNNWVLKNYLAKQIPTGGLYEYFDTKFKGRAANTCSFSHSAQIRACNGNLTFNSSDTAPTGTVVFFVEHDLNIKKNFELDADSSILFVVKGDVIVDLGVNRIDGIYIVKGTFDDSDVTPAGVADASDALTVNGSVIAETGLALERYFTSPINKSTPANKFIWDPKFLLKLSELVGTSSIVWKEVAP